MRVEVSNENASKIECGYAPMNAIAPHHDFARCQAIATPGEDFSVASSKPSCGFASVGRRQLARQFNRYGGHLTDDVERRIFEEMTRNCNFRV
jgi:hypothetical protein